MKGIHYTAKEKEKALKLWLEEKQDIFFVAKKMKCTERTLWRWKSLYNGTLISLENKSTCPKTPHPNSHTIEERKRIIKLLKKYPNLTYLEIYSKLRKKYAYNRHYLSMYRYITQKILIHEDIKKYTEYVPQKYDTPTMFGIKMQMDVKYVPTECIQGKARENEFKFYQYTMIDEATRERFIYPYYEKSAFNTVDFVKRAITYYGYIPLIIQTDNGMEFTHHKLDKIANKKIHIFDMLCNKLNIEHKLIKVYTPRHNGKVERSHRNDNNRFYKFLKFETYEELKKAMSEYLIRSNNILSSVLRSKENHSVWLTPLEKRKELLQELNQTKAFKIRILKK